MHLLHRFYHLTFVVGHMIRMLYGSKVHVGCVGCALDVRWFVSVRRYFALVLCWYLHRCIGSFALVKNTGADITGAAIKSHIKEFFLKKILLLLINILIKFLLVLTIWWIWKKCVG